MKTFMITGASSGLGFETAKKIAKDKNNAVILACRNPEKAEKSKQEIISETGNKNISIQIIDTSDLESVRKCVANIKEQNIRLDVLICNAGIPSMYTGTTKDGFELVFATNYLGHFLLTMELLPVMNPRARIIPIASDMHNPPMGLKWKGADYLAYESGSDHDRYSYTKLCAILFTYKLNDELKKINSTVTVNSFNPGFMSATNFSGRPGGGARDLMIKTTMPERYGTLETSSSALAELATSEKYEGVSGHYIDRTFGIGESSPLSHDKEVQDELWKKSQEYTGVDAEAILKML